MQPCTENVRGLHKGRVRLGLSPALSGEAPGGRVSLPMLLCGGALRITLCFVLSEEGSGSRANSHVICLIHCLIQADYRPRVERSMTIVPHCSLTGGSLSTATPSARLHINTTSALLLTLAHGTDRTRPSNAFPFFFILLFSDSVGCELNNFIVNVLWQDEVENEGEESCDCKACLHDQDDSHCRNPEVRGCCHRM